MRKRERLLSIKKSPKRDKKYVATVRTPEGRERVIHFGARDYEQYRDSTPLRAFASKNHGDPKRRENYFRRHSGTTKKAEALRREWRKSNGRYNAKILSHQYLW